MMFEHYVGINHTPALILGMKGWLEIYEAGLAQCVLPFSWDNNAVMCTDNGHEVGVIVWSEQKWCKSAYIIMGYVKPEFRRIGIYKLMWNNLVEHIKKNHPDLIKLEGGTHPKNMDMREVMHRLQRKATSYNYTYDLKA
jgi:hypothetical protein